MVKRNRADIDYHEFAVFDDGSSHHSLQRSPFPLPKRSVRTRASDPSPRRSSQSAPNLHSRPAQERLPNQRATAALQQGAIASPRPENIRNKVAPANQRNMPAPNAHHYVQRCGGPMLMRMQRPALPSKLTTGERLQIIRGTEEKRLKAGHQVKMKAAFLNRQKRRQEDLLQLRERRKAQSQLERARIRIASRRRDNYVIDLTQNEQDDALKPAKMEEQSDIVTDDEDDEIIRRLLSKKKYSQRFSRESHKHPYPESVEYLNPRRRSPCEASLSLPLPAQHTPGSLKENVICVLSSDDEVDKPSRLKKQRPKRQKATVLVGLPASDATFRPPSAHIAKNDPTQNPTTKSTVKRLRSPLKQLQHDLDADIRKVENSAKQLISAEEHGTTQDHKALELKISTVPGYPKEIDDMKFDDVIVVSDEETSVQTIEDTPIKSGMKRVSEKRTIPVQSFYGKDKQTNGSKEGDIHIPALNYKHKDNSFLQDVIPLEHSDEDDVVFECELVAKPASRLSIADFEMPSFLIKNEPHFEPDPARARDVRFRPLESEELAIVHSLSHRVPKQLVLARIEEANIELKGEDFGCLRGSRWLNDEILNSFAALINSRNKRDVRSETGYVNKVLDYSIDVDGPLDDMYSIFSRKRPRTHVFNTFFFARLTQKGYDYSGVRRWLKRAGLSVTSLDLILVPINLKNFHWVLTAIDLRSKHFLYLDSTFGKDTSNTISALKKWLFDEVKDKHGVEAAEKMGINVWPVHINPPYLPRQQDGGSCGIFTLYMADYLERGLRPNFTQEDIRNLRWRTALFLKDGYLPN